MKKFKATAFAALAVLIAAASLSGCNTSIGGHSSSSSDLSSADSSSSSAPVTTEAPTTAQPTTVEPTTEAPTTEEQKAETPNSEYSTESNGDAVLIDSEKYHDSYLGITFTMPEWVGKAYAVSKKANGNYILGFYEKTNYDYGVEHSMPGFGMMFEVFTAPEESKGNHIDYPAGSVNIDGTTYYLTYFKPTDVRFDRSLEDNYRSIYNLQRDYFLSGVVDADKNYVPSTIKTAVNLTSE